MNVMLVEPHHYIFPEDKMGESQSQIDLSNYLLAVLTHMYAALGWFITGNLEIWPSQEMLCPFRKIVRDIMVFKGVKLTAKQRLKLRSWRMKRHNRPAPQVVFEISSRHTWENDLDPKPDDYRLLGVKEYFAYDPAGYWPHTNTKLRGWGYAMGTLQELTPDDEGRLWSQELESYLKPDGAYLRFYDRVGNLRLTAEEALQQETNRKQQADAQEIERLRRLLQTLGQDPDATL